MFGAIWLTSDDCYYVKDSSRGVGRGTSNVFKFIFMVSGACVLEFYVTDVAPGSLPTQRQRSQVVVDDPSHPSASAITSQVVTECTAAGSAADHQKALWLHDWLLDYCQYDYLCAYCDAEGALARGAGACEVYRCAYAMLLKRAGVEFGCIEGGGHV